MVQTRRLLVAALLAAACAPTTTAPRMDLSGSTGAVLLVITVSNSYKPAYQATELALALVPVGARRGGSGSGFGSDFGEDPLKEFRRHLPPVETETERSATFVLLAPLAPGSYTLEEVRGEAVVISRLLLYPGIFTVPIGGSILIRPGRLTYLGHVDAVNRERRSDQERRAGPLVPVAGQVISGFAGGTLDISIRDTLSDDLGRTAANLGSLPPDRIDTSLVAVTP